MRKCKVQPMLKKVGQFKSFFYMLDGTILHFLPIDVNVIFSNNENLQEKAIIKKSSNVVF
jgi:hypothetical protein